MTTPGKIVVSPTKVGYVIIATDGVGLEKKFQIKNRNRNKPGVVLCSSIEQLKSLAEINSEILSFYEKHYKEDILLGCIFYLGKIVLENIFPMEQKSLLWTNAQQVVLLLSPESFERKLF
ncbi:Sua5/YciO/YrdC/YwlC family protein [Francisella sp. SYW-9]|uniref:Sua5/YciO/YrdC/YwlC family protein n=1 Tax=Francisella sp. SYW-9 TaxID=2610888 RepID=UPI00168D13DF|nr:Sua5/YciO/YrdC/YwlC family protein [Francisella sp. SYW-9]